MKSYGNKYLSALLAFSVLCTNVIPSVTFAEDPESAFTHPEVKAEEVLGETQSVPLQDVAQEMPTLGESSSDEGEPDIKALEIEGITYVPKVGGEETNPITGDVMEAYAQGLKIELVYSGENPEKELYALYQKLHGVNIDGVDYPLIDPKDNKKSFSLWQKGLWVYDKYPTGVSIIEDFKKRDKHKVVLTFKDGDKVDRVEYTDDGYQEPERENEPSTPVPPVPEPPKEPENPSVPEGESPEGIGRAYKVKEVKIEYGDLKAYFADEKEITDNDVSEVDYVIVNGKKYQKPSTLRKHWSGALLVASNSGEDEKIIEQAKTKEPIELVVYFKDGSFFKSAASKPESPKPPVAPEPPKEPEAPSVPEGESPEGIGRAYKVKEVKIEYGDLKAYFADEKEITDNDVSEVDYVIVNGKKYQKPSTLRKHWSGALLVASNSGEDEKIIEQAKTKEPIELVVYFKDGSFFKSGVSAPEPPKPPVTPEPPKEPEDPKPPVKPEPPATSSIASNYVGIKTDFDGIQFTIIVEAVGDAEKTNWWEKKGLDIKHFNEIESIQVNKTVFKDNLKEDFFYSRSRNTIYSARKKVTDLIKEGVPTAVIVTFKDKSVLKTETQVPQEPPVQPEPPATSSIASKYVKVKPVLAANQFKIEVEAVGDAEKINWWDKKGLELADYNKIKSITVNGVAFEEKEGFTYSSARNTVESSDENVLKAAKKATPIAVTILFNDNSKLEAKGSEQPLPKPPEEPEQPSPPQGDGIGSKYTIDKLVLDEKDKELEVIFHQSPIPIHLTLIRKIQIGEQEFEVKEKEAVGLGEKGVKFINPKVFEKAKEFGDITKLPIIITFSDKSQLRHNVVEKPQVPELTLDSVLEDGEYTLTFKTYLDGRGSKENKTKEDESTLGGYFDVRAKLQIKGEEKKVSILNKFYADLILDFAAAKDGTFVAFDKEVLQSRKNGEAEYVEYTTVLKDLKGVQKLAVLGSGPMGGDSSQIGSFELYRKADLVFDSAVTKGWSDYKVIEDKRIERENNDKILNEKLVSNGLDKNKDGKVDEAELMEAKGDSKEEAGFHFNSLIDLTGSNSSGKITDISYLEHLGPNVDAIILDGNSIEELPENVFKNATGLTHIFLSGNKITKIHEGAFKNLTKLKYIDFDSNLLEEIPDGLFEKNEKLSVLSFMNNQLTSVPSDLIKEKNRLEQLYLQDNKLTQLPDEFFGKKMYSLTRIELSNNQLESLPSSLGNLKALKQLNLSNNKLLSLPKDTEKLKKLEKLDLEYNHLESLPTGLLVNMVSKGSVYLDLSANRLTSLPLDEMMAALKSGGRKFSKLEINKNYFPISLTAEDKEKYEALGVRFENYVDSYFPQMGNAGTSASASASQIKAKQEFDLLELLYWDLGDSNYYGGKDTFQTSEEFMKYLRGDGLDRNGVDRNTPREEAIKQILEKKSILWRIENVLYKNDKEISKQIKENRPTDSLVYTFEDASMKKGDSYRLERSLYVKGVSGWLRAVESVVEFTATTDAEIKEGTVQELSVQLNELGTDKPSMANRALEPTAKLVKENGKFKYTIQLKPMYIMESEGLVETFSVFINEVKTPVQPSAIEGKNKFYTFVLDQKADKVKVAFTTNITMMGEKEAELVFTDKPVHPKPQPQPERIVKGYVLTTDKKQASMADRALDRNIILKESATQGMYEVIIHFNEMEMMGQKAGIDTLSVKVMEEVVSAKAIENKKGSFVFLLPASQVKTENVSEDSELELVMTTYPKVAGHDRAVKAWLVLDWNGDFKLPQQPQPQPQPERIVKGYVLTADKKQASMADKSLDRNIVLKPSQTQSMYEVTLHFNEMEMMGQKAGVNTLAVKAMGGSVPAKPVEGKKGSFVFMLPASQVKAENSAEDTEIALEMTTYPKVAGHDRAVEAVLVLDWNGDFKLPEKPQPQQPQQPGGSSDQEKEELSVPVWMKSTNGEVSVGNKALVQTAKVMKQGSTYTYTLTFRPVEFDVNGKSLRGNITSFSVRGQEVQPQGSDYIFELSEKVDELFVSFTVDVMDELGVGAKDAYIVFDWSGTHSKPSDEKTPSISGGGSSTETTMPLLPKTQITVEKLEKKAEKVLSLPKKHQKYYSEQTLKAIEKALEAQKKGEVGAEQKLAEVVETARVERITNVLQEGYMKGYEGNRFKPNDNMTRAEASMMFADLIDEEIAKIGKLADIKEEAWYTDTMKKLATLDYIKPQKDGNYEPNGQITRAEYAYLLAKLRNLPIGKKNLKDVPKEHWAAEAIAACVEAGIVVGYGDGTFRPEEPITRAEAVVMINRTFNVKTTKVENSLYKDVPKTHWAYDSIMTASKK